jgi:hypothetical protein
MSSLPGWWLAGRAGSREQPGRDGSGRALVARSHAPAAEPALVHVAAAEGVREVRQEDSRPR